MTIMPTRAQIVYMEGDDMHSVIVPLADLEAAMAKRGAKPSGHFGGDHLRVELRGHPKFFGFHGPQWGKQGDEPLVRYEDARSSDILSR